ncbi:MAG: ComEC family competence protein [Chlorobi bacterium]|nr:ComEC family competence protein [Chlorobiota bacterium]
MKPAEIPMLRLIIPFVTGIVIAVSFSIPWWILLFAIIVILFILAGFSFLPPSSRYKYNWISGFFLFLLFVAGGILRTEAAKQVRQKNQHLLQADFIEGVVTDFPVERTKTYRCRVKVSTYHEKDKFQKPAQAYILLYLYKGDNMSCLIPGQRIWINSRITSIPYYHNPGEFNYRRFMLDQGVYGQVFAYKNQWGIVKGEKQVTLTGLAAGIRHSIVEKLKESGFNDRELAVAAALMAGERSLLDPQTKQVFSQSGAMHVLAISGLHVGILYYILYTLLAFLERSKYGRILRITVVILVIWTYALVTGLSPSVVRASAMFSFFLFGDLIRQKSNSMNILASSAFLILLIHPFLIRSAGFQLSYLAVTGIIIFYHPVRMWGITGFIVWDKIWSLIAVSLAAQIGTAPLSIFYFHQFPVWFVFTNLLVIPLVTLIIYGFILWIITIPIAGLAGIMTTVLKFLISLLLKSVTLIQTLPVSVIPGLYPQPLMVLFLYGLIASAFLFLIYRRALSFLIVQGALLGMAVIILTDLSSPTRYFTVFNIPRKSVIGFTGGNKSVIFDLSSPRLSDAEMSYYLGLSAQTGKSFFITDWFTFTLQSFPAGLPDGFFIKKGFFCIADIKGYFFDSCRPPLLRHLNECPELNYVVFSNNRWWNLPALLDCISCRNVILDATVPGYAARHINRICREAGINVYDVKQRGAFMVAI